MINVCLSVQPALGAKGVLLLGGAVILLADLGLVVSLAE